jgi:predicted ATP-binding protein involved in virulence
MHIKNIHVQNFKRFSDLKVINIPASARLVLIVGPNGSGKSSLFDALLHWYRSGVNFGINADELYYRKDSQQPFDWGHNVKVALHDGATPYKGCLYIRTAYRNDPDFSVGRLDQL